MDTKDHLKDIPIDQWRSFAFTQKLKRGPQDNFLWPEDRERGRAVFSPSFLCTERAFTRKSCTEVSTGNKKRVNALSLTPG
jgi:hypothetical protein